MFQPKLNWRAIVLLIGVLAIVLTSPTPARAQTGVWWWGTSKHYGITLINLTNYTLKLTNNTVTHNEGTCYPIPFEFF